MIRRWLSQLHIAYVLGSTAQLRSPRSMLSTHLSPVFSLSLAKLRKPQEIVQGQKYKLLDLWPKNMRAMHHQLTKRKEKLAAKKQQFRTWLNMLPKYSSQVLRYLQQ